MGTGERRTVLRIAKDRLSSSSFGDLSSDVRLAEPCDHVLEEKQRRPVRRQPHVREPPLRGPLCHRPRRNAQEIRLPARREDRLLVSQQLVQLTGRLLVLGYRLTGGLV